MNLSRYHWWTAVAFEYALLAAVAVVLITVAVRVC